MAKTLTSNLLGILLFAIASASNAVLIDFDILPGGGALPNNSVLAGQYASLGVTFSGFENGGAVLQPIATTAFSSEFGGAPVSGQVLENRDVSNSRADIIRLSFSGAGAAGIEFDFIPFGGSGPNTRLQAFDAGGIIFDALVGGPAGTNVNFHYTGLSGLTGVTRLDILQPADGWVWGLDNFAFNTADRVPEPTTLVLMGLGLAGIAFRRRKAA